MLYLKREQMAAKVAAGELKGFSMRALAPAKTRASVPSDEETAKVKERFGEHLVGRVVPFRISNPERVDDGLALDPKGCDLEQYDRVPMVLWMHNAWSRPRIADSVVIVRDDAVDALAVFYPRELSEALDGGFSWAIGEISAFRGHRASVGFDIVEAALADEATRKLIPWALDVSVWRLREWSVCNMGMDDEALTIGHAKAAGVDVSPIAAAAEQALDESTIRGIVREELERIRAVAAPAPAPVVSLPSADALAETIRGALGGQLPRL